MPKKNILFLSLVDINAANINENGIYQSLLRRLSRRFNVYILSPIERRNAYKSTSYSNEVDGFHFLKVKIGNITKTNKVEKGLSTIDIERKYLNFIKKNLSDIEFDLVLYPTPPITFYKVIKYIKKRDNALTYLMLKDIFPQNAVDIGFFSKKSPIYKYFRNKEKKLYEISDYIGCMSEANVRYLLKNNPDLDREKVEVFPNSIEPVDLSLSDDEIKSIRIKYNLPLDKKIFIYGGNLGKPQGLPFLIKCIEKVKEINDIMFLIVGNGTEFGYVVDCKEKLDLNNLLIMERLEKEEFDKVVASSDIGIISLDHRFTIPNYPSRILSYMQAKLPVLAITDKNTDIGSDIVNNNIGRWCKENSIDDVTITLKKIMIEFNNNDIAKRKIESFEYLKDEFNVNTAYDKINEKL